MVQAMNWFLARLGRIDSSVDTNSSFYSLVDSSVDTNSGSLEIDSLVNSSVDSIYKKLISQPDSSFY